MKTRWLALAYWADNITRAAFTSLPVEHFLTTALAFSDSARKGNFLRVLTTAQIITSIVAENLGAFGRFQCIISTAKIHYLASSEIKNLFLELAAD